VVFRVTSSNAARTQLDQSYCFWQGLSIIERRRFSNATYIVESAEATVIANLAQYAQAIRSANTSKDNRDDKPSSFSSSSSSSNIDKTTVN
jgi:hypothetical protein